MLIAPYKKTKNWEVGKDGVIEIIGFTGHDQKFARIYFDDGMVCYEDGKKEKPADDFDLSILAKHNIKI